MAMLALIERWRADLTAHGFRLIFRDWRASVPMSSQS
jgi:hypothetical protein